MAITGSIAHPAARVRNHTIEAEAKEGIHTSSMKNHLMSWHMLNTIHTYYYHTI